MATTRQPETTKPKTGITVLQWTDAIGTYYQPSTGRSRFYWTTEAERKLAKRKAILMTYFRNRFRKYMF